MGINDLAIFYQSKLYDVKRQINLLNSIGIDANKYLAIVSQIDKEVDEEIDEYNKGVELKIYSKELDKIYLDGITKLEIVSDELYKYDQYIVGYYTCEKLNCMLTDGKISNETLKEAAISIINIINGINDTDTREYDEEKNVVEKIYSTAYQVMKLEFIFFGESAVFNYAKGNPIVDQLFSNLIEKDLVLLRCSNKINPLINESIHRVKSNGINFSYLDKILLTSIALLEDNSIIDKLKGNLDSLQAELNANANKMEDLVSRITYNEDRIVRLKNNIHKNNKHNKKELLKRSIAGLGAAAIVFGSYQIGKITSIKRYKTTKETYSTLTGYSSLEDYERQVYDFHQTILYEYEPYKAYDSSNTNYIRNYTEYNITNIAGDCNTLEDFLSLNLDHASRKFTNYNSKHSTDMTEKDFYEDNIVEIVKTIQDSNDFIADYNWFIFVFAFLIFGSIYFGFIVSLYDDIFDKINSNKEEKKEIEKYLQNIKDMLAVYKQLADKNIEVREEFNRLFEKYKELFQISGLINDKVDSVLIDDPKIVLDERTKKLLKIINSKKKH